jgi:tetratricopeptide (TPR) repeat protein
MPSCAFCPARSFILLGWRNMRHPSYYDKSKSFLHYLRNAEYIQKQAVNDAILAGKRGEEFHTARQDGVVRATEDFDNAIDAFEMAIQIINQKEADSTTLERLNPYLLLARAYVGKEDYSSAIDVFESVLELKEVSVDVQVDVYKQWTDIYIQFAENLSWNQNDRPFGYRGVSIRNPDDIENFIDNINEAVEKIEQALDPTNGIPNLTPAGKVDLYRKLAIIYQYRWSIFNDQSELDRAKKAMDDAIFIADNPDIKALLFVEKGNILRFVQDEVAARNEYNNALDQNPSDPKIKADIYEKLAESYMLEYYTGKVIEYLEEATKAQDIPARRYRLALFHIKIDQLGIAEEKLNEILNDEDGDPDYVQALVAQALIHDLKQEDAARDEKLRKACDIEPIITEREVQRYSYASIDDPIIQHFRFRFRNQEVHGRDYTCRK